MLIIDKTSKVFTEVDKFRKDVLNIYENPSLDFFSQS